MRRPSVALGAVVGVVAVTVYAGALRNGFVYDDVPQVVKNPWIRDLASVLTAFTNDAWAYLGTTSNYYRPMMHVLYAAAHAAFGLQAWGFHVLNLVLHAAASILVFATTRVVLDRSPGASPRRSRLVAAAGALLFAVHPIHTEAVSWISAATDLLVAVLALASLYAYATLPPGKIPSRSPRYLASVAAFFVATLAKEVAIVIPGLLVAFDLAFRRGEVSPRRRVLGYAPFAAAIAAYFLLRWNAMGGFASISRHEELTKLELVLNVCALLAGYVGKVLWPVGLTAFHAFHPVRGAGDPRAVIGVAVAALLAAGLVLSWRRSPAAWFSLACFLLPLLPSLYLTRLGENPFAERYLYLPSFGFTLLLACAAQALVARRPSVAPALGAACGLMAAAYAWGVVERQPAWHDDVALWRDAAAKSPDAPIPHYNLGVALQSAGDLDGAIRSFEAALRIEQSPVAWASLGAAYLASGEPAAAVEPLRAAVALAPGLASAHHNLGVAYERLGMTRDAVESYRAAVRADPREEASYRRLRALGAAP